jgi:hypothetical protein
MAYTDEERPDEFHVVPVKLHENYLPEAKKKGKYYAKTAWERTITIEDLASFIVERRGTKWKYGELVEASHLLCREIGIQLCDGYAINLDDLFLLYPHIKGVFERPREGISEEDHPLTFHFRILRKLYELAEHIRINVIGLAGNGAFIEQFTDVKTNLINQKATVGGMFVIEGCKIKIAGTKLKIGLFFTAPGSPPVAVQVAEPFAVNEPHQIIGIIPSLLPDTKWTLEVRTQYSSASTMLKEVRIIKSDFTVSV